MEKAVNKPTSSSVKFILVGVIALLILGVVGFFVIRGINASRISAQEAKEAAEIEANIARLEETWGIRITQIVVTADGGLIDLRYQVIDPNKAVLIFNDLANVPKLFEKTSGLELSLNSLPHRMDLEPGKTYFILYRNIQNAVKPGGKVTITVGDIQIENYPVVK